MTNGLVFDVSEFKKLGHEKQRLISSLLFSSITKEIHQHFSHKNPVVWTAEDYFIAIVVLLTILKFHLFLYHYFVFLGCMFSSMYLWVCIYVSLRMRRRDLCHCTAQKMKFFIKDFLSKCNQIRRKLHSCSNRNIQLAYKR